MRVNSSIIQSFKDLWPVQVQGRGRGGGRHKLSTLRHVEFKNLLGDKFCTTSTSRRQRQRRRRQQRRTVCDVNVDAVGSVVVLFVVVVVLVIVVIAAFVYLTLIQFTILRSASTDFDLRRALKCATFN